MILIVSTNERDLETDIILKYLKRYKRKFLRVNFDEFIYSDSQVSSDFFIINKNKYFYKDFTVVWVRRYLKRFFINYHNEKFDFKSNIEINNLANKEVESLFIYFVSCFDEQILFNGLKGFILSKIEQIFLAKKLGLNPPKDLFTNSFSNLDKLSYITKPSENLGYIRGGNSIYSSYTEEIDINKNKSFFLSYIQEKIEYQYEIRLIVIKSNFYGVGLFSNDNKCHIDIKKRDFRVSPVNIPNQLKTKIITFMKEINFNIAVFDFIKDLDGNYRFIEMNPIGKFSYYSNLCNFNLEKNIVQELISYEKKNRKKN